MLVGVVDKAGATMSESCQWLRGTPTSATSEKVETVQLVHWTPPEVNPRRQGFPKSIRDDRPLRSARATTRTQRLCRETVALSVLAFDLAKSLHKTRA